MHETTLKLAYRLQERRIELGYTRDQLAWRAGMASTTLKAFERTGQISLDRFVHLVAALDRGHELDAVLERIREAPPDVMLRRLRNRVRGGPLRRDRDDLPR